MIYLIKNDTGEKVVFISEEGAAKTLSAFPNKYQSLEIINPEEDSPFCGLRCNDNLSEEEPVELEDEKD